MVKLYTDGSSLNNPGRAGYGWVAVYEDGSLRTSSGHLGVQTNNVAELNAILKGLQFLDKTEEVHIYSDSKYALGVMSGRDGETKQESIPNNAKKNIRLIKAIGNEVALFPVVYKHWVKGHYGNSYNDMADRLAQYAAANPGIITSTKEITSSITHFEYSREEIIDYAVEYIRKSNNVKLAQVVSDMLIADIEYHMIPDSFNANVKLRKEEK